MARTSSALLAALIAVAPLAAAYAQAPAEQTTPSTTAPSDAAAAATPAPDAAATPAPAGDAAAPAADATAAPATGDTPAPADGQAAAATGEPENKVGTYYTKSTHGDWQLRCLRTPDGKDPCELYQLLRDEQQTPVAEISVVPFTGEAAAVLNFVAPLETDLQAGMGLKIDSGDNNRYPFIVCAPIGCVSRLGMTADELNLLKRGSSATVSVLPFGGKLEEDLVNLKISLAGFTAGFTELQGTVPAAQ